MPHRVDDAEDPEDYTGDPGSGDGDRQKQAEQDQGGTDHDQKDKDPVSVAGSICRREIS